MAIKLPSRTRRPFGKGRINIRGSKSPDEDVDGVRSSLLGPFSRKLTPLASEYLKELISNSLKQVTPATHADMVNNLGLLIKTAENISISRSGEGDSYFKRKFLQKQSRRRAYSRSLVATSKKRNTDERVLKKDIELALNKLCPLWPFC